MRHVFGLRCKKTLRCQYVSDFACADAKRQRTKRAIRGGVAVAADNGHTGLRCAEFGSNHMDNAPFVACEVVESDSMLFALV